MGRSSRWRRRRRGLGQCSLCTSGALIRRWWRSAVAEAEVWWCRSGGGSGGVVAGDGACGTLGMEVNQKTDRDRVG